jgi:hypothetical protein
MIACEKNIYATIGKKYRVLFEKKVLLGCPSLALTILLIQQLIEVVV